MVRAAQPRPLPGPRRRGRPKKVGSDVAILEATRDLLLRRRYSEFSVDEVARITGVGRQTVYRRWPSKAALVIAALSHADPIDVFPDTGSFAGDLAAAAKGIERLYRVGPSEMQADFLFAVASDPKARDLYWSEYMELRKKSLIEAVARGVARGELDPTTDPSMVTDLLVGPLMHRWIMRGKPLTPRLVEAVVDGIKASLAPRRRAPTAKKRPR